VRKYRIGILGTGEIAERMAITLNQLRKTVELYAIASRTPVRAKQFAQKHGIKQFYGSYFELVCDNEVDFVYVATPHAFHFENAKLALNHGKHVLCEKPFTINSKEASYLFNLANHKGLFINEAMWTKFLPIMDQLKQTIHTGAIGQVKSLVLSFGKRLNHVPRLFDPALAGGALLDICIYPITFTMEIFGDEYENIYSSVQYLESGVDAHESLIITYKNRTMATVHATQIACTDRGGSIYGTDGYIKIDNINNPEIISVYDCSHNLIKKIERPKQVTGLEYEIIASIDAIRKKEKECYQHPHSDTLKIMHIMDTLRNEWGLIYPNEKS
jgi:predicted dehydrogenase